MSDILGGLGDTVSDVVGAAAALPKEVTEVINQMVSGGELGEAQRTGMSEAGGDRKSPQELQKLLELHLCMGLNACKNHDQPGTAPMAGMGQCATVLHVCHGANERRGQGGCGYTGPDAELAHLMWLCNQVIADFPDLGGDNSAHWLLAKLPDIELTYK